MAAHLLNMGRISQYLQYVKTITTHTMFSNKALTIDYFKIKVNNMNFKFDFSSYPARHISVDCADDYQEQQIKCYFFHF